MSRFMAPLFDRPFALGHDGATYPIRPISPSEADTDQVYGQPYAHGMNHEAGLSGTTRSETPSSMFRRISTLAYNKSGNRESLDRSSQRASRSLVLVIPPSIISQANRNPGHTLISGPSTRLSQGVLLPLFPTMYGQLTAIAREFNFPNTSGLCLYMHIVEGDTLFLPRISDEAWGILWNHLFAGNAPASNGFLPISGRIEFDIDPFRARWFDSWVNAPQREPASFPSSPPSHYRQDSKTTSVSSDDAPEATSAVAQQSNGLRSLRHVPRKLSLVNRVDLNSTQPTPVSMGASGHACVDSHFLSPIPQEEEPKTANEKLNTSVKSWRASASITANALVASVQITLDSVDTPNSSPLDDPVDEFTPSEFNLEDYTYPTSSVGPPSVTNQLAAQALASPVLHDRRSIESVRLTPSVCTSLGPEDYDPFSPVSSVVRLPTPDIAMRMFEEVPLTPSTADSFGPPPLDQSERCGGSCPVTPPTPALGGLQDSCSPAPIVSSHGGAPYETKIALSFGKEAPQHIPWRHCWPIFKPCSEAARSSQQQSSGGFVYPNPPTYPVTYPDFDIYPAITCKRNTHTSFEDNAILNAAVSSHSGYPLFDIYPATLSTSYAKQIALQHSPVKSDLRYPVFNLYPAVYPHFDIYPAVARPNYVQNLQTRLTLKDPTLSIPLTQRVSALPGMRFIHLPVRLRTVYPVLEIYKPEYPYIVVYPVVTKRAVEDPSILLTTKSLPIRLQAQYPALDIYPVVYPWFNLYPVVEQPNNTVVFPDAQRPKTATSTMTTLRPAKPRALFGSIMPLVPPSPRNVIAMKPISPLTRVPLPGHKLKESRPNNVSVMYSAISIRE